MCGVRDKRDDGSLRRALTQTRASFSFGAELGFLWDDVCHTYKQFELSRGRMIRGPSRMLLCLTIVLQAISKGEVECKEVEVEGQVDGGLLEGFELLGGDEGPRFERLVDGEDAGEGKHPWHVGLVREESKTGVLGWIR